ncbi:hypothetical protein Btru_041720 [Bulinus truncatus]|nr:hypothetical protein Btru_041720 [Bulinus truncatus]
MATCDVCSPTNTTFASIYTTTPSTDDKSPQLIIADMSENLAFRIFDIICSNFVVGMVSLMGVMTNITTISVLSRQVNESINIAFLAMSVSDLCVVILALWYVVICIINETNPPDFPFEPLSFLVMASIIPKMCFVYCTCWLTALIAVIRCLCVVMPFKVGVLFTPRNTSVLTTGVFAVFSFCYFTAYFRNEFIIVFFPEINATRYIMVETTKGKVIDDMVYYMGFVALPLVNLFIIVFCTLALIIKVKASSNWRLKAQSGKSSSSLKEKSAAPDSGKESNTKEGRLTKMIITIMAVFIVCNMPNNLVVIARVFEPEFTERGRYQFTFIIIHNFIFLLETVNSSVSLFIFYSMSTKFKSGLQKRLMFLKK